MTHRSASVTVLATGALIAQLAVNAQEVAKPPGFPGVVTAAAVSIPFVGCLFKGQAEPIQPPQTATVSVPIGPNAARALAYYGSAVDLGVLGPRGWHCEGLYGSGGYFLFVYPKPIDPRKVFAPDQRGFDGPVIEISERHRDQNGDSLDVAQIIARVFPYYKAVVTGLMDGIDFPASKYPFGPYPTDRLTYRSKTIVEYRTPAQTEGLGTHSSLEKGDGPIEGVAILSGVPPDRIRSGARPDLILLSVRLPRESARFGPLTRFRQPRSLMVAPSNRGLHFPVTHPHPTVMFGTPTERLAGGGSSCRRR